MIVRPRASICPDTSAHMPARKPQYARKRASISGQSRFGTKIPFSLPLQICSNPAKPLEMLSHACNSSIKASEMLSHACNSSIKASEMLSHACNSSTKA